MSKSRSQRLGLSNYVQSFDATETSAVVSWADPKYVSAHQATAFLSYLIKKSYALFIFAWMSLSTRHHPDRTEDLVQTNSSYVEPGIDMHNNRWTGILSYDVLNNGNDKEDYPEKRDRMPYQLPHVVAKFLAQAGDKPFRNFRKKLYREARKFRKAHGGVTPTGPALARTFDAQVMPHMQDELLARILGGDMIGGLGPASHYYGPDSIEINLSGQFAQKKLVRVIRQLTSATPELLSALESFGFRGTGPSVKIGSNKTVEKQSLEYQVEALHAATHCAFRDARLVSGVQKIQAYARASNLLNAQYYQMVRHSQMPRTIADRYQGFTDPSLDITITSDKDSSKFERSRVNFRVDAERKQRANCEQVIAMLVKLALKAGMVVECDERLESEHHAIMIDIAIKPKDGIPRMRLSRFKQKRFKKLLRKEGIVNFGVDNANRHYVASHLHGEVPQPLLNLALNHTGPGRNPLSKFSFMSLLPEDRQQFVQKLEAIFPFRAFDLPHSPWLTTERVTDLGQVLKKARRISSKKARKNNANKKPQPDAFPDKPAAITGLPAIIAAYHYLWKKGFAKHSPNALIRIGFVLALCLEMGAGKKFLDKVLPTLAWDDRKALDDLQIPFARDEEDSPFSRLFLSHSAAVLLEAIQHNEKPDSEDWIFALTELESKQRCKAVRAQLIEEWQILKRAFEKEAPHYSLPSLPVILDVARVHPILEIGLEPFISHQLSDAEPTTAHSARRNEPVFGFDVARPGYHRSWLHNFGKSFRKIASRLRIVRNDFQTEAKEITDELLTGLNAIAENSQGDEPTLKSPRATAEVHALIDGLLQRADRLNPEGTTSLHLCLEWFRSHYSVEQCGSNLKASTVGTYLSQAFNGRLFAIPEAQDLTELQAEQLNDYLAQWVDDNRLDNDTARYVANRVREALSFGSEGVYFPDLVIPAFGASAPFKGIRRNDLIAPHRLDSLIRRLMKSKDRRDREQAVVLILAAYGGLRESEIRNLRLDDVIITNDICWLYIRYGKSRRARRVIPLHLLAHPELIAFLYECRMQRYGEFNHNHHQLKDIAFLGRELDPRCYERHELSDPVIERLKSAFGHDADLHLLRHYFCSWLVVRLGALRYPHIVKDLKARGHWMFRQRAQHNLLQFFTLGTGELSRFDINALVHIARLMGHASLRTTFQYYVQTFSVLQREAVQRANRFFGGQRIDHKTVAALFPGILSSWSSYAKLTDKTVNGLFEYLLQRQQQRAA